LRGQWVPTADGGLLARVAGTLLGGDGEHPATGTIAFWPRRFAGVVVGPRRIALDVTFDDGRLALDTDVDPPPFLGIIKAGLLTLGTETEEVRVSIDPVQLLELWLRLNL
jgi:hypothetical protein